MDLAQIKQTMRLAIEQARFCRGDVPVGAIIIRDDLVIASAYNQREALADPLGHAELGAIRQASQKLGSWRLNGSTIFSTLEPCPMCAEAIIQSRMEMLVFGAYDPIAGAAGSAFNLFLNRNALPTPEIIAGILEEDCSILLKQFFLERRNSQQRSACQ